MTTASGRLRLSYADNEAVTVAERLAQYLADDPSSLWVASGYLTTSVWGVLGDALQAVGDFRLLLGRDLELEREAGSEAAQVQTRRMAELVDAALRRQAELPRLPTRDEAEDVARLAAFLERQAGDGRPVVKLWDEGRFLHAKAFVTRGAIGIGSANFTAGGLSHNRELVGWRRDEAAVADVREWFLRMWEDPSAVDHTSRLIARLRASPLISESYEPYDVLIRTLAARYGTERPPSLEAARFNLHWFQEDAVARVIRLLDGPARGALLADAVGLGKTYVALGAIHHFLYRRAEPRRGRGRPVLVIAPKSLVGMWQAELDDKELSWACEVLPVQQLRADFDHSRFEGADLVVIDEAHRLRGGGTWFRKAVDLVAQGREARERRVLLLTATPVNTSMDDLVRLLRVLTKNRRGAWAPEVADFERYLGRVEREGLDPFPILDRSLVRRSRSDILEAQREARAAGVEVAEVRLPERRLAHVDYRYGGREDLFDLFEHTLRRLALAPYDLSRFRRDDGPEALPLTGPDGDVIDDGGEGAAFAPGSLAGLIAMGLLVRFQSSISALRRSLRRLDAVMRRAEGALSSDPPRLLDLRGSPEVAALLRIEAEQGDRDLDEPEGGGSAGDDPLSDAWERALADAPLLDDPDVYDLDRVREAIRADRELIAEVQAAVPAEQDDGKLQALRAALTRPGRGSAGAPALAERIVLVFTQFRDTARYLHRRLTEPGGPDVGHVELIDGGVPQDQRARIAAWFDPRVRDGLVTEARMRDEPVPRVLVTTDVLAEGHNLQAADCVVNYDLHFNPQVAVQRAGRVDRLESPHSRVHLVSFLPPEALERHIRLLGRLDRRFRRIHGLGLGDERVMPLPGDTPGQTLEQVRRLYRDDAGVLDEIERSWTFGSTDYMRQPLEAFLAGAGRERLREIPVGVTSVRRAPGDAPLAPGVFISLAAPADRSGRRETFWRYYPREGDGYGAAITDETAIFRMIACRSGEPRAELADPPPGPSVVDWALLRRAAGELADQLTLQRSTQQAAAGGSEASRRLRLEIRGGIEGLDVPGAEELLERLLQVDVRQHDGRSGWSRFQEARRALRRAGSAGERREAGLALVAAGLDLFGPPEPEDGGEGPREDPQIAPEDLQLVAYEVVAGVAGGTPPGTRERRLFPVAGEQLGMG